MIETLIVLLLMLFPYPETIPVRITGLRECVPGMRYHTEEVPFQDYVKGVMVSEWGTGWDQDAMYTGAIAIKNYALSRYYQFGYVWDCDWSQVYNPNITREDADRAVEETWDIVLFTKDWQIFTTYYNAWGNCPGWDCLIAWGYNGIFEQAERGWTWREILSYAYDDYYIIDRRRILWIIERLE